MRVVIGGAHNGKRDYVRKLVAAEAHRWFDFGELDLETIELPDGLCMVIERIDEWLARTELPEAEAIDLVLKAVEGKDVLFILTDMTRGIVPIDARQRALRDTCGRLYQQLFSHADEVTRIWYGLPHTLKKRGECR